MHITNPQQNGMMIFNSIKMVFLDEYLLIIINILYFMPSCDHNYSTKTQPNINICFLLSLSSFHLIDSSYLSTLHQ